MYIELKNKFYLGENLSSLICAQLGLDQSSKEILCKYIKSDKLLIVLDISSKITKLDPVVFNWALDFFVDQTMMPKFLIVSKH